MGEWLVLGKQRIDRSLRTNLDAAVASNADQNGTVGLAGGTGIVRLLSGVTVEILLEHQLAVARDEKTVNIERVVLQVGGQDFLDECGNGASIHANIGKRGSWPTIIGSIRLLVDVGSAARSAREKARRVTILAPREVERRMRIHSWKQEAVRRRIVCSKNAIAKLLRVSQRDLCAVH